jgi:polyhydroxyalkanoate synthase subunit PhaC
MIKFDDLLETLEVLDTWRADIHEQCKAELYRGTVRLMNASRLLLSPNNYLTRFERTPAEVLFANKQLMVKRYWQDYYQSPYIPLLFIPPLMVTRQIYDLQPKHSFVRHLLDADFDIFLLDFGAPKREDRTICLDDYVRNIRFAINQVLEITQAPQVTLIGYSMGGIFGNICAALDEKNQIRNVVALGSPCDINRWPVYGELAKVINRPIIAMADALDGVPPIVSRTIFKMMKPINLVTLPVNLMVNLWDEDYIVGYEALERWFDDFVAYPRDAFKQFFNEVVTENKLYLGELKILGQVVDLRKIKAGYLAVGGREDFIGHPESVRPILDLISTVDKTYIEVSGGHLGMLAGRSAVRTWDQIRHWLVTDKRSQWKRKLKTKRRN